MSKIIVEESRVILPGLGWKPVRQVLTRTKDQTTFGYYFRSRTLKDELRDLWLGCVVYRELKGVFVGATPKTLEMVEKLARSGFTFLRSVPRSQAGTPYTLAGWSDPWLHKNIITLKLARSLEEMSPKERQKYLEVILKTSVPWLKDK